MKSNPRTNPRTINYIVVHCTAGRTTQTLADLRREFRQKGWQAPGYHYVVTRDGHVEKFLGEDKVANGVKGHNHDSIHIAYIGGINDRTLQPEDNRTPQQKRALEDQLRLLHLIYPKAVIQGHRDFAGVKKACPCFDAKREYRYLNSSL